MKRFIPIKTFSSRIERFNQINHMNIPIVKYLDYNVPDKLVESVSITTYEFPTKANPKAILYYVPEYGDYCLKYGNFF